MYWNIAGIRPKDSPVSELVVLNNEDQILEVPRSNIYVFKSGVIKGASIHQGAYADITKPLMLKIFETLKFSYLETEPITLQDINEADEIFLVNAIDGIRWVLGFEGKRYLYSNIRKINNLFIKNLIS